MMVMMVLKKLLVKTMFKNSGDWTLQLPCGMIMSFTQTNQVMLLKKWTKKSNEMSDWDCNQNGFSYPNILGY